MIWIAPVLTFSSVFLIVVALLSRPTVRTRVYATFDGWTGTSSEGFNTEGWPTKKMAEERVRQHRAEVLAGRNRKTGLPNRPMEPIEDFRARHDWDGGQVAEFPFPRDDLYESRRLVLAPKAFDAFVKRLDETILDSDDLG